MTEQQPTLPSWLQDRESAYRVWQKAEGIPRYEGSSIANLHTLDVGPWPRMGQKGAFVNLAGQARDDGWVIEIAPGGHTEVQHHLFEITIYVLDGRGTVSFGQKDARKQTVEWQRGSLFSPPLNSHYQLFNLQGQQPARLFAVTSAPMAINLYADVEFIYNCPYVFTDRYNGEDDYFTDPGHAVSERQWETNFVPDVRLFEVIPSPRGRENASRHFQMSGNQMAVHLAEFGTGTYKKGHRHGAGAHVVVVDGQGYSLLWFEGEGRRKVDWQDGTVLSPMEMEYHQHFNTGPRPARYLALRLGNLDAENEWLRRTPSGDPALEIAGIPYELEDPAIYDLDLEECRRNGATVALPRPSYAPAP